MTRVVTAETDVPSGMVNGAPPSAPSDPDPALLDPAQQITQFTTVTESLLEALRDKVYGWLSTFVIMLPNIIVAALVLLAFVFVARWLSLATGRVILKTSGNRPISDLLASITRVAVSLIGLFVSLGVLNLDKAVTSLVAGVGVLGIAAGFAFQDVASNFMAGIIMALNRPFDVDDLVELAGKTGTVLKIEMRATMIRTLDGLIVTLPNKDVFQSAIVNYTSTPERRMELEVGVAYDSNLETVRTLATNVAATCRDRDPSVPPEVIFERFGDSSIDLKIRVWLLRGDEKAWINSRSDLLVRLKHAFDDENITIPFPIRTLDFGAKSVGGKELSPDHTQIRLSSEAR